MIALVIAAAFGFMVAIPAARHHDNELPISTTGKARRWRS